MARREYPIVRARLYGAGRRYVERYDGFGRYDMVADLWNSGSVACNVVQPSALGVGAGLGRQTEVPAAVAVAHARLNIVVCRPFLDTRQAIGPEHFDLYGGEWVPLEGLGMGSEVRLYQYDGRDATPTGAVSRFTLPRNPVFCVSLHRAEPGPGHDWAGTPPCTEIQLGVGSAQEWAIVLPYGGHAFLMRRVGGQWEQVPNSSRAMRGRTLEGNGPGERQLLWIAVWRKKLVLSTDGFAEDIWVCPDGADEVNVPRGKVALWHNAGQWSFSLIPTLMTTAVLDSMPIEAGYDTDACVGETLLQARGQAVLSEDGVPLAEVVVEDTTEEREDLTDYQRAWRATITPHIHRESDPVFETAVSPELHAVQIGQYAEIVDTGVQSWEDISGDVRGAVGQEDGDGRATLYELDLDNTLGQWGQLGEYRECQLELGWMLDDGRTAYEAATTGYIAEPAPAISRGPTERMAVAVIDPMIRLRDEKCDARVPVFDGWLVRDAVEWVLDRCGIPAAMRELEDTGVRLSEGAFDRPLWRAEPGRSWAEVLAEVAEFDHRAAIFFDEQGRLRKACRYCRRARTADDVTQHDGKADGACGAEVDWELFTRSGLGAPPHGERGILAIRRARRSLSSRDYVNYVTVCGVGSDGQAVRSTVFDTASLFEPTSDVFVGWRKMAVVALETYTSQEETNRLAQGIFDERGERPEHVSITIPLEPGLRVGHVIRVNGGETVGVQSQKYRVESVRHSVRREEKAVATTEVMARWLREAQ